VGNSVTANVSIRVGTVVAIAMFVGSEGIGHVTRRACVRTTLVLLVTANIVIRVVAARICTLDVGGI
jgi:hypothetical protein